MSDQHLGDEVHDLLDNRLSAARAAQAMRHLDNCADCRMRWNDLREAREALQTSSAGIDMTFARELLDRDRIAQIASAESKHQARAARGKDRRPMLAVLAVFVVLSTGVGAAYVAGAPAEVSLEFAQEPATMAGGVQTAALQAASPAGATNTVSYLGPDSMRGGDALRSWVHPNWKETDISPVEASVVRTGSGDQMLVASVLFNLEPIVITEQHGQLPATLTRYAQSIDLGHTDAYVTSERPRQLVWQTGDVVVSATCSCALRTLEAVASCFPAQENPQVVDRVVDGFRELSGFAGP